MTVSSVEGSVGINYFESWIFLRKFSTYFKIFSLVLLVRAKGKLFFLWASNVSWITLQNASIHRRNDFFVARLLQSEFKKLSKKDIVCFKFTKSGTSRIHQPIYSLKYVNYWVHTPDN